MRFILIGFVVFAFGIGLSSCKYEQDLEGINIVPDDAPKNVEGEGCKKDSDCGERRICEEGKCINSPACINDNDCKGDRVCENNICVSLSSYDDDDDKPDDDNKDAGDDDDDNDVDDDDDDTPEVDAGDDDDNDVDSGEDDDDDDNDDDILYIQRCPEEGTQECIAANVFRICQKDKDDNLIWSEAGECEDGSFCQSNGECKQAECVPQCSGLECGPDPADCVETCGACISPPEDHCASATHLRQYERETRGFCEAGVCRYDYADIECDYGCEEGACKPCAPDCKDKECGDDGCGGICLPDTCVSPPPAYCFDAYTLRTYSGAGSCKSGVCFYQHTDENCPYGCTLGECKPCAPDCNGKHCGPDGCGGSCGVCDTPPAPQCLNTSTLRTYQTAGAACESGACSYLYADETCAYGCESGACNDCIPATCITLGKQCGTWADGCGANLNCGSCTQYPNSFCTTGGQCDCTPATCVSLGKECGTWSNRCGADLNCGSCAAYENSYCETDGSCACTPASCAQLGKQCGGPYDNKCGGNRNCGDCTEHPNSFCNASGQCACTTDCAGKNCGDDGCGGSCGTCTAPETCGGGGTAGVCGCAPNCAGKDCGDDGCGGSCGICSDPKICDASGLCVDPPTICAESTQCFKVPPTMQTKCYNGSAEIACPASGDSFYGQDAHYADKNRTFIVKELSGKNVVEDSLTGLMWQQEVVSNKSWTDAKDYCATLTYGGFSDWRLPTIHELRSIIDYNKTDPAIDTDAFAGTPSISFWSSTVLANDADTAFWLTTNTGQISSFSKTGSFYARCVREQGIYTAETRFSTDEPVAGEKVVTDLVTGLIWQQTYATSKTWEQALNYCETLNYGSETDWRLPNINELASLVDYSEYDAAIDKTAFAGTPNSYFWSSSTVVNDTSYAWYVLYNFGRLYNNNKTNSYNVRCVRGGPTLPACSGGLQCFEVPPTMQTKCYNETVEIACPSSGNPFYGQDAQYLGNSRNFTVTELSGKNVVEDSLTGLMWQQEFVTGKTWQEAIDYCEGLDYAGFNDWRLPTAHELASIVDYSKYNPTIDATAFPGTPNSYFWSSSTSVVNTGYAWHVRFDDGAMFHYNKSSALYARCVRLGSEYGVGSRYTVTEPVSGEKVVSDSVTGLMWQQGYVSSKTWEGALSYCEGLSYGGHTDWRLPNINELRSIVDYSKYNPSIDATAFLGAPNSYFWSSSTFVNDANYAWHVNFAYGDVHYGNKTNAYNARCVRGGLAPSACAESTQCFKVPPTNQTKCYNATTEITCPSSGNPFYGQDAQYSDNSRNFTVQTLSGKNVVNDSLTGLMWQQEIVSGKTWQDAKDYCEGLSYAGFDDWQLPNPHELASIVDYSKASPAIDATAFPGTPNNWFWSSSALVSDAGMAWGVNFDYCSVSSYTKASSSYARCVRLGQPYGGGDPFTVTEPVPSEKVVSDSITGLMWQQEVVSKTWEQALSHCEGSNYGGHADWRLPNVQELRSILDYSKNSPSIDTTAFPGTPNSMFFSSSTYVLNSSWVWYVSFNLGHVDYTTKTNTNNVRCVRGGP